MHDGILGTQYTCMCRILTAHCMSDIAMETAGMYPNPFWTPDHCCRVLRSPDRFVHPPDCDSDLTKSTVICRVPCASLENTGLWQTYCGTKPTKHPGMGLTGVERASANLSSSRSSAFNVDATSLTSRPVCMAGGGLLLVVVEGCCWWWWWWGGGGVE